MDESASNSESSELATTQQYSPQVLEYSYHYCIRLARREAKNFYFSFFGLPKNKFRGMCVLYAFMRETDDLADDESLSVEERKKNLASWRTELNSILEGKMSDHPILPAMQAVIKEFHLQPEHLFAVFDGVESDLTPFEVKTEKDLDRYCYQVAGVVGLNCIRIWGYETSDEVDDSKVEELAIHCGNALQRTNILRDLCEDYSRNRIYLASETLQKFQFDKGVLSSKQADDSFRQLMDDQIARTVSEYQKAIPLIDCLHADGRPVLVAMLKLYGGILQKIRCHSERVLKERVSLPFSQKIRIACGALTGWQSALPAWMTDQQ